MNIYTNNQFTGYYPVGSAAIVRADSPKAAADKLNHMLKLMDLPGDAKAKDMKPFPDGVETVRILVDGDY